MGTVVPKGSLWDESLQYVRQEWRRISGGTIEITVYPGGVLGDETEMVRQIRQGRIQAAALSSVGLSRIDNGVSCLQVPMMFASYAELDFVRSRVAPILERRIEAKGFKVLNWADGGWVHTFTKKAARTPDDVRRMKLFTSAGDADTERLYKEFGFHVVPLALTDMITALQTGMIEAFSTVPLFAELQESYKLAPHMIDVPWIPLVGGTVMSQQAWDAMPAQVRPALLDAARTAGDRLRGDIRKMGSDAVLAMEKRGLTVTRVDATTRALWESSARETYPRLRGTYCPADLFDEVQRIRLEFRP
jgi:TRAP-type C4-dicarboxylate transport system substrate-binding protein